MTAPRTDPPRRRPVVKIYTRRGDDGTTALWSGARVRKDDPAVELLGAIDEAQAALGVARSLCPASDPLGVLLVELERDLWIAMAEVATAPPVAPDGARNVDLAMVERLEAAIDRAVVQAGAPAGFAVPGESRLGASLDFARTVVRRAERLAVAVAPAGSLVVTYLNRLSDLCWALARAHEETTRTNRGARVARRPATLTATDPPESTSPTGDALS